MRYGIISDIHSNLEALEKVLSELERESIDRYVCLGDIVGYAANPNECVELVRNLTDLVIAGNHDHAAVGLTDLGFFNPEAAKAALWTGENLKEENADYLRGLELALTLEDIVFVHSSPFHPERWYYVLSLNDAIRAFLSFKEMICFLGHSHVPATFTTRAERYGIVEQPSFKIEKEYRYVVNVGSVGQPRDYDPRACYAIYDTGEQAVGIKRVAYLIEAAQKKIKKVGLPEFFAKRLELGA